MNQPVPDELISAYFDGEVTPEEREQVEHLLESSMEFRQWLDDASKLSAILHSIPHGSAPADLITNVRKKVDSMRVLPAAALLPKRQSLRREWTAFSTGMFVTMATLLILVGMLRSSISVDSRSTDNHEFPSSVDGGLWADSQSGGTANSQLAKSNPMFAAKQPSIRPLNDTQAGPADTSHGDPTAANSGMHHAETSSAQNFNLNAPAGPFGVATNNFTDESRPSTPDEFLESLKNGQLSYRLSVDPSNAVGVAELMVVDVEKGTEEMQVLLHRRSVQHVENGSTSAREKSNSTTSADDLVVFYVQASADQVADTIKESLKSHPDIYKSLVPQVPMDFAGNTSEVASNVKVATSNSFNTNLAEQVESKEGLIEQQTVTVEALRVVNVYAVANGRKLDDANFTNSEKRLFQTDPILAASKAKSNGTPIFSVDADMNRDQAKDQPAIKPHPDVKEVESVDTVEPREAKRDGAAKQDSTNPSQGYTTFRLPIDNTRQDSAGRSHSNSSNGLNAEGVAAQQNQLTSNLNFNSNYSPLAGMQRVLRQGQGQGLSNRATNYQRDPRQVRMLIVLRPDTPGADTQAKPGVDAARK